MIPSAINSDYPKFVPNQVLTSDNLNDLFGFLDEQQRITRTNLLGIGIVCGLQVKTGSDANGSFITITKGTGVTSRGFLVTVPEITFHQYNSFNAVHPEYYDRFVDIGAKTQKMPLWELKQLGEVEDPDNPFKALSQPSGFLSNKVVLLFVELLETSNKNCDPGSCDDKGITVNVNFRALLILKSDLELLNVTVPDCFFSPSFNALAEIVMPRWDVKNNAPVHADDITESYRKIMSGSFILQVQTTLSEAYKLFKPVILDEYPADPFEEFNLDGQLAFLNNGTINPEQQLHIQYYYDLLSDLSGAYKEFCDTGNEVISCCVPEASVFPRHLLLGEAIPLLYDKSSDYRNYFIYSPLFQQKSLLLKLKLLFRRMVLMLKNFKIPPVVVEGKEKEDIRIRITPSKFADVPLSAKAIPYYYTPKKAPAPLFINWSAEKTFRGKERQILSYHAEQYFSDDFTLNPLHYDLEPYNFFRIEGIIGKKVGNVLDTIKTKISKYRLPFKVVALATGKPGRGSEDECCFLSDLEMQFRLQRQEMLSCLKNSITFWGSIEKKKDDRGIFFIEIPDFVYFDKAVLFNPAIVKDPGRQSDAAAVLTNNEDKIILPESERKNASVKSVRSITTEIFKEQITMNLAGIYQGYQKKARVDMFALPEPQNASVADNIPFYALIIIDESEQLADLLDVENIGDFDTEAFAKHVKILHDACSDLSKLVAKFRKTEYLIEKMRVMVDGHDSEIRKIADAMPVMEDGDASKIMMLLLNLNSTEEFINDLKGEKDNYEAQKEIIITYFNTLDLDAVMIPVSKEPGKFKSKFESMTEQLNNCKCSDFIEKLKFLLERYDEQLSKLKDINNFSVYVKKNPGLQHKAGVTAGGTFIIVYKGDQDSGEKLEEDIVLADFFLPYTCCSNCTPVEVTFQEAPAVKNQPPVAKAGDSITIELPLNKVNLDGTNSTDPDGSIQSYLWEQAAGPDQAVILDPSSAVTLVSGLIAGEYIFKLTVKDNEGAVDEDTITVKVNLAVEKTCNSLAKIISGFDNWNIQGEKNKSFQRSFGFYVEVVEYFDQLRKIVGLPVDDQIKFFAEGFIDMPTPDLLKKWFDGLQAIIMKNKDLRLIALGLFRVLNQLAMYIVCIQDSDYDQAKIPMDGVFDFIKDCAKKWMEIRDQLQDNEVDMIKNIAGDILAEIKRVKENGEGDIKKNYLDTLKEIIKILTPVL